MKSYRLQIYPFAEIELKNAESCYNIQKDNLGKEFIDEIEAKLQQIVQYMNRLDVRKTVLKRFPYSIYNASSQKLDR